FTGTATPRRNCWRPATGSACGKSWTAWTTYCAGRWTWPRFTAFTRPRGRARDSQRASDPGTDVDRRSRAPHRRDADFGPGAAVRAQLPGRAARARLRGGAHVAADALGSVEGTRGNRRRRGPVH